MSVDLVKVKKELYKSYYVEGERIFLKYTPSVLEIKDLVSIQKRGFNSFIEFYLNKLMEEVSPIYDSTGENLKLEITNLKVSNSTETPEYCRKKELTYGGIISGNVKLTDLKKGKILFNKRVNIGIMPLLTDASSYVVNGVERVIVSQLVRSYGIFFEVKDGLLSCKIIPERGAWLEVFVQRNGIISARVNKGRKFPVTALLRVMGLKSDDSILENFKDLFEENDVNFVEQTLLKDASYDDYSGAKLIYGKIKPGELVSDEDALEYVKNMFLNLNNFYLGAVARRKINAKLNIDKPIEGEEVNLLDAQDLVKLLRYLVCIANNKKGYYLDDSDHLSNKRIRTLGELLYSHLQPVMRKFIKSVKGKLSVLDEEETVLKVTSIVNFKIIDNAIRSFFATSQLSQFLDQVNPLSELEHKRRLTVLGQGGLKRETAKFEVRDVHPSQYGRICPIQTPEGQNIGLVVYQALFSRVDKEGFMETPAFKVEKELDPKKELLVNRIAHRNIYELNKNGKPINKIIVKEDEYIDEKSAEKIEKIYSKFNLKIRVKPFISGEIDYISPERDEKCFVADATTPTDEYGNITVSRVPGRHYVNMEMYHVNDLTHVDVNPFQIFSSNVCLIPFVNHNDAVRAAVAANQQRQALPLVNPEGPLVGTGLESKVLKGTHFVIEAEGDGEVIYVDGKRVKVKYKDSELGTREYKLIVFERSNHKTCLHQVPRVEIGQKVKKGDVLAEGPAVQNGEIALGRNLRVAFMPWNGYNYEDAIVISDKLVKQDLLTSIWIEKYEVEVCDTKLGPEVTTNDIPGVSMSKLSNLDENGIVRIGTRVKGGDILVGKITPKAEGDLTPEEKLIQAIFGEKSKSVKDSSLYMPAGTEGKVIDVVSLDAKKGDKLEAGIRKKIKVYVATLRKIEVGDKLAGKHGNKGIVSIVVPEEDMPYTTDGEPVDVVLNSLGVISRMNLGQVFESQLGLIAKKLGVKFAVPLFSGFGTDELEELANKIGLDKNMKFKLIDGQTGEFYDQKVTVGYMHILKLVHMVEDKLHARAVGPYSLITQQPLGGKSRDGGQRFGEMEVWALEAYGAVYALQEMLTVKSDDVAGRNKLYNALIKGEKVEIGGLPESFNLVTYLLKGLCQNIQPLTQPEIDRIKEERLKKILNLKLAGVTAVIDESEINNTQEDVNVKDVIDTVIEEMKDFGELDE